MKSFINKGVLFKRHLLILLFTSVAFLFLTVNTFCNKDRATKDSSNTVDVRLMGAAADGITDDTKAFQRAIDQAAANGGGTVWVPSGNYSINADTSIYLKSNVILSMADGALLIADTSSHERYYVIKANNIHDAQISGGQIIGDRDYHIGTTGEWGYGIAIQGCDNVQVKSTNISNCWGDGLIVGGANGKASANITVKGVACKNNRRQAISVFNVDGLVIDSCQLSNTNGTKPGDGIDIEPDVTTTPLVAQNISITHCDIFSNAGNGIEINVRGNNSVRNVTIQYNKIHANKYSGYIQGAENVTFIDNWLYGNDYDGNKVHKVNCLSSMFEPNTYKEP